MNFLLPQFYIYYFLCLNTIQLSRNRHNQTVWSPLTPILLFIMMVYQQGKALSNKIRRSKYRRRFIVKRHNFVCSRWRN